MTWNIRGINDFRKLRLVQAYLVRKSVDICLLQETHLTVTSKTKLHSTRWGHVYMANYSNYSRGVAILIKKSVPWTLIKLHLDPEGRYILALGSIYGKSILIVNTYGPNIDDPTFFRKLWHNIQTFGTVEILWGGDFNTVLSPDMDRVGLSRTHHPQSADVLRDIMSDNNLIDPWRHFNPNSREGTCITQRHNAWSRIDFWLLSPVIHSWTKSVLHHARTLSDHSPVLLSVNIPPPYRQPFKWRLPYNSLLDPVFNAEIRAHIEEYFLINTSTVASEKTL